VTIGSRIMWGALLIGALLLLTFQPGCATPGKKYEAVCSDCQVKCKLKGTVRTRGYYAVPGGFMQQRMVDFKQCPHCKCPFSRPLADRFIPDIPATPTK
jgi:hypothetical protein